MTALARALGGEIRYSTVWEDHLLVERGLAPRAGEDVLTIASAGCNALALLLRGPRRVVAIDLNPAQTAVLELKVAAIRRLPRSELLSLLGVAPGPPPLALYERVRSDLSVAARAFWDESAGLLARPGLAACGRLETWFRGFREAHLARLAEPAAVAALLSGRGDAAQAAAFERLATPALERAFVEWFGRERMSREGRHPAQLRHVPDMDVGRFFWDRFRWACTHLPLDGNFYMERFLTGRLRDPERGPPYLARGALARLRGLVDRLELVTADLDAYLAGVAPGTFDRVNLSDVLEYASEDGAAATLAAAARATRPGGRICWWSLLVPRTAPAALRARLRGRDRLARALSRRDRAWFYRSFHVEEVLG